LAVYQKAAAQFLQSKYGKSTFEKENNTSKSVEELKAKYLMNICNGGEKESKNAAIVIDCLLNPSVADTRIYREYAS
jgi:hypothetical protein